MARIATYKKEGMGSGNAMTKVKIGTAEDPGGVGVAYTNILGWDVEVRYKKAKVAARAIEDASANTAIRAVTLGTIFDAASGYTPVP